MKKKNIKIFFILTILLLIVYFVIGLKYLSYNHEKTDNYIWAEYHLHSNLSDGIFPPEKIAEEAKRVGVKLLLLTDHGDPNLKSSILKERIKNVYIIGGSESALPEGHLNSFGENFVPLFKLPPFPPDAIDDIKEWGGFSVVTYPEDPEQGWHYWEDDLNPDGLEIINLSTYFRKLSFFGKLVSYLYLPFSRYSFLRYLKRPSFAFKMWDSILKRKKVWGFFATNAHGRTPITKKIKIKEPSYHKMFSLLALGIKKKYKDNPEKAVRKGHFFSVIRGAGEPQIFDFYGKGRDGKIFEQGDCAKGDISLFVELKTKKLKYKILLLRDGERIKETINSKLSLKRVDSGFYRVEVYLLNHPLLKSDVPWIISNPIFVNYGFKEWEKEETDFDKLKKVPINLDRFKPEKDKRSKINYTKNKKYHIFKYYLSQKREKFPDVWCSLALREKQNLINYSGFYFVGESKDYMRYWIEIRNKDGNYYSSFKVYPNRENQILIPFHKFYRIYGKRMKEKPQSINSIFISINGLNSVTNFSSILKIKEFGFYENQ